MIPLAVVAGMVALALTAKTNSARTLRLAVLYIRDKAAGQGASPAAEISAHGFVCILYVDFASPSPGTIGAFAALKHLAANRFEFASISVGDIAAFGAFAGNAFDSIKIRHSILPTASRGHVSITASFAENFRRLRKSFVRN